MEEKSDKEKPKEYIFDTVCFSTNFSSFSSIKILNQFFMSTECLEVNFINDYNVTFKRKLKVRNNNEIECNNYYQEITPANKVKIKNEIDCIIIFLDLEYNDSLGELNKVLKILSNLGKNDKSLYIVNFFTEEKDIKQNNKNEKNVKTLLEKFGFSNFDILTINMNISEELIQKIDKITLDILQEKNLISFENNDSNLDKSDS